MSPQHLQDKVQTLECGQTEPFVSWLLSPSLASETSPLCLILLSSNPQLLGVTTSHGVEQIWYSVKDCQVNKCVRSETLLIH